MMRRVSLLEACDDPQLLAFKAWPGQRAVLKAIDEGPRMHVFALGRRSGKSRMAAAGCAHNALLRPDLDAMVAPGERRYALAVATNLAQARLIIAAARAMVEQSPLLARFLESATEDELRFTLESGALTAIKAFPCSSRGIRGWPVSFAVMDEAAHFLSETEGPAVAKRVWDALKPATAQFGDAARLILSSTPWGSDGLFAEEYQKAASGENPGARAHHATTAQMNPTIAPEWFAAEEASDPDNFRSEFLAMFEGSGAAYLDMDRFRVADRAELAPEDCRQWVAGLDPAFSSDPFGLVLVGRPHDDRRRMRVGLVRAWKPSRRASSFEERRGIEDEILGEVVEVCKRYGARAVTDQYAAKPVVDRFQRAGISIRIETMTAASKTAAFSEMRARLYDQTLELYDEPQLLAELRRLRTKFTAGSAAVVNPRVGGSHGDRAQALALAVFEQARYGQGTGRTMVGGGESITADLRREFGRQRLRAGDA